jgi:hypothetical protein
MSQKNTNLASAINLAEPAATVLLPASDLAAILSEVRRQREEIDLLQENQEMQASLLAKLKGKVEPKGGPCQRDRGEVLRALLAANGGKMFAKDARQQMRLPENLFSELLKTQRDFVIPRRFHLDRRRIVLELI